jgi:ABC-2 type transport system permease protein
MKKKGVVFMDAYLTATRYALIEQGRNRVAFGLLLIFLPLWDFLIGAMVSTGSASFKLLSSGAVLTIDGHDLVLLTAGFNALTLIIGFMIFAATMNNTAFDRRLVLSGYGQPALILAKLTMLISIAALVALYASVILLFFWRSASFPLIWLGYFGDALIYGALGLLLGALAVNEVVGFFIIIMVSLIDTFIQAPIYNPLANKEFLRYFPSYGPIQIAVDGGFTGAFLGRETLITLGWFAGLALLGLVMFWWRTRAWHSLTRGSGTAGHSPAQADIASAP